MKGGYVKNLKALWDKKSVIVRKEPSLVSPLKCIENGLLVKMERGGIEKMVENDIRKWMAQGRSRW